MSRGLFYFRAESRDWDFVARLGDPPPFDAAIVCDRYLAEYPQGHEFYGRPAARLALSFADRQIPWILDPETARLAHERSKDHQGARDALRPQANVLPLPMTPEVVADTGNLEVLIEAAERQQLGSYALAVPYFEASSSDDPYMQANLALIARARGVAGDRELVAYLQVLQSRVSNGTAIDMLYRFVDAGAQTIVIRARRLTPEVATAQQAYAYARLVQAGARTGTRIIADCTGRLGPMLVGAGADAFSSGAYRFRTIPKDLHPKSGGGGSDPLMWELPGGGALALGSRASRPCMVTGCAVPNSSEATTDKRGKQRVRIHNCHTFQAAAREAAGLGLGYSAVLAQNTDSVVRGWARALQALERRAA